MKRISKLLAASALGAAVAFTAGAASAAVTVTVNSVTGTWGPVNGGTAVTGIGSQEIRWGTPVPAGGQKSGYRFDGVAPPPDGPYNAGQVFDLGTFTHFNFPIQAGTSINSAQLNVEIKATVNNGSSQNITLNSVFNFDHEETPNNADPCADGNPNGVGDNINGCADIVTPTLNVGQSETVMIDGSEYRFDSEGFAFGPVFETIEEQTNTAILRGSFSRISTPVPVPATLALLGAGLVGLGMVARRRAA